MSVDAKVMTVIGAVKQSLQMSGGPGSSVNSHPNPFFLNVTGEINLKHMAELIVTRLEDYETALKSKLEKLAKESEVRLAKELGTGELKVEITKV
jgi:methionine-rich copper-binding protein CopC